MLIDWFTVAAQITNFLVLVWLLKRFLYGPILNAMAQREKRVRETIESAVQREAEAGRERADFERKNAEFDREKQSFTVQARQSADDERARLLDGARAEIETLRSKWREGVAGEQATFRRAFTVRAQEEVTALARQALKDLAGVELDDRIAEVFLGRINQLDGDERQRLVALTKESTAPAIVRSATQLPPPTRARIEAVLHEALGVSLPVEFEINAELLTGIEFCLEGYKVSWTLSDYLAVFQKSAAKLLDGTAITIHERAA